MGNIKTIILKVSGYCPKGTRQVKIHLKNIWWISVITVRFCGTWSIACSQPPCPPTSPCSDTGFVLGTRGQEDEDPSSPAPRQVLSISYTLPTILLQRLNCRQGQPGSRGALPLTGPSRRMVGLPSAQQAEKTGVSAALASAWSRSYTAEEGSQDQSLLPLPSTLCS